MHKPESVQRNETLGTLLYYETQTDKLIPARKPDLEIVNKNK